MAISQNLVFKGEARSDDQFDHPPGAAIARFLETNLRDAGWQVCNFDNWRDCGWSLRCSRQDAELQVAFAEMDNSQWMLQVAPLRVPGLLGRMLGKATSATPGGVYALSRAIHDILGRTGRYSDFKWRWDGPPDEKSSPEPLESDRKVQQTTHTDR